MSDDVRAVEAASACAHPEFPRLHARTQGFSLGVPRHLTVAADRVLFLRGTGDAPAQSLWVLDGEGERVLLDPATVGADDADIPPEERARRERARERGSGVVTYACDADARHVAVPLGGKLLVCDAASGEVEQLAVDGPVVDPRPDPTGTHVAYVEDGALWVVRRDGTSAPRRLVGDRDPHVTWGLAEFVAGEEMDRTRGYWWAPDGRSLLVARVDVSGVREWWIASPVDPAARPTAIRYPAAGTDNARVQLALVQLDGSSTPVSWDADGHEYLADVVWGQAGPPTLVVQSRDQQTVGIRTVDTTTGETTEVAVEHDVPWIELVAGSPTWLPDGRLVRVVQAAQAHDDTRRLEVDGQPCGDTALMIASIVDAQPDGIVVTAHVRARPWCTVVARIDPGSGATTVISELNGVAAATTGGGRIAITQRTPGTTAVTTTVDGTVTIPSAAVEAPPLPVVVHGPVGGQDEPVSILLVPSTWTPDDGPLPVLVDPYGGPGARRVVAAGAANLTSAWFAANGFAVLVTDGPGSPGHSLSWGARIAGDMAGPPLEGQIAALRRADEQHPGVLDLERVAIRGWSFGGYLAALAVLRRPDVFHAAVSGAPVTDWRLYDTHYTERYLGHPDVAAGAYDASSLIGDAPALTRPLLLIHGLADDNVVSAHTLRLSRALLEAGRPHEVLPLSGVTHFTPDEEVNANLLLHQLDFLRRSLS
ncbi:prolyl oligopeptidase family serine peptidase [Euzebya sp.]|uniref:S9 family peptidase n=1 Tax=Euzebya sp. TaxID=1971409 RepID=UPI0035131BB7